MLLVGRDAAGSLVTPSNPKKRAAGAGRACADSVVRCIKSCYRNRHGYLLRFGTVHVLSRPTCTCTCRPTCPTCMLAAPRVDSQLSRRATYLLGRDLGPMSSGPTYLPPQAPQLTKPSTFIQYQGQQYSVLKVSGCFDAWCADELGVPLARYTDQFSVVYLHYSSRYCTYVHVRRSTRQGTEQTSNPDVLGTNGRAAPASQIAHEAPLSAS